MLLFEQVKFRQLQFEPLFAAALPSTALGRRGLAAHRFGSATLRRRGLAAHRLGRAALWWSGLAAHRLRRAALRCGFTAFRCTT